MKKKKDPLTIVLYAVIVLFALYAAAALGTTVDLSLNPEGKLNFDGFGTVIENTLTDTSLVMTHLKDSKSKAQIDELLAIMLDVICSEKSTIRANGEELPKEVVKSTFLKLDESHIDYVLTTMKKNTTDVRNIRAYLITALYNAPKTIDSYYQAWVNYDLRGI